MTQIFPKWTNQVPKATVIGGAVVFGFVIFVFWYWFSPYNLEVGYAPVQPVEFSHKRHAGDMGMDCRYCHAYVEKSPHAGVPPTQTCMNCHASVKADSMKLAAVRDSWRDDKPIEWIRIHKVGDYGYFDHSAHINNGIGCASCHGRIDQMPRVRQEKPLSMGWCLECHRNPAPHLRPQDKITDMAFQPTQEWIKIAKQKAANLTPPIESCSGCHR